MGLKSKDLLGMKQLTAEEIMEILDTAKTMKLVIASANKKTSHLQGKSVVVDVCKVRTLSLLYEKRCGTNTLESPDRTVHSSGNNL